jgi:hypothetical protein
MVQKLLKDPNIFRDTSDTTGQEKMSGGKGYRIGHVSEWEEEK